MVTINEKTIEELLREDPRFRGGPGVIDTKAIAKAMANYLPGILESRIKEVVTLRGLFEVSSDLLKRMLRARAYRDPAGIVSRMYRERVEALDKACRDIDGMVRDLGYTDESEVMLTEEIGLGKELRRLYTTGNLTFERILRYQPGVFLPKLA